MGYGQMPVWKTTAAKPAKKKGICAIGGDTIDKGEPVVQDPDDLDGGFAHVQCAERAGFKIGKK